MSFTAPQILFVIFAALMLASAGGVVVARNQVTAAMSLVASFFFLAAIYALLSAHVIAVLQVLVYAGAIVVLFLFVIMLLSLTEPVRERFTPTPLHVLGVLAAVGVLFAVVQSQWAAADEVRVTRVEGRAPELQVSLVQSPLRASPFVPEGKSLGTAESARGGKLVVLSAGPGDNPVLGMRLVSGPPPAAGDRLRLAWSVEDLYPSFGTVAAVGDLLYTRYLLPFEITSLLLLVAIIGAVVVAKERV